MKLSVIVPAFNVENYIHSCLTSLLNQHTAFDFEVIVSDDASQDATAREIKKLQASYDNLTALFKQKNEGLPGNLRSLINYAKGEYVAYLDGDDLALPNKLQRQVEYLDRHKNCSLVYHESEVFDSETDKTIKNYSTTSYNWHNIPNKANVLHLIKYGTFMQASSVMFRNHEAICETVPSNCKFILDYPFYILNAGYLGGTIDFIPEVFGRYRMHSSSFTQQTKASNRRREQSLDDMINACRNASRFGIHPDIIANGIAHHNYAAALYFLKKNDSKRFQKYIYKSVEGGTFVNSMHELFWRERHNHIKLASLTKDLQ